jgi:hypothetical protein
LGEEQTQRQDKPQRSPGGRAAGKQLWFRTMNHTRIVPYLPSDLLTPLQTLSYLHRLLSRFYKQNREKDCVDLLCLVFGVLGIEYADAMTQLREHAGARSNFLYSFIANIGELIEELAERSGA